MAGASSETTSPFELRRGRVSRFGFPDADDRLITFSTNDPSCDWTGCQASRAAPDTNKKRGKTRQGHARAELIETPKTMAKLHDSLVVSALPQGTRAASLAATDPSVLECLAARRGSCSPAREARRYQDRVAAGGAP
jgi:hypothetical protein